MGHAAIALAALAVATGAPAPADDLTAAQRAGQRVIFAFDGPTPPRALERRIRRGKAAGVILFSHNVRSQAQIRRLTRRLQAIRRPPGLRRPLLVMVDQEGGLVRRIPGAPAASAAELGRRGRRAAGAAGRGTGRVLRRVGVNVDLAPVLDVARRGSAMERERRAFARTARRVTALGGAFARGLAAAGVAPTGKHFPGFGAAPANTDFRAVRIRLPARTLRRVDMRPYRLRLPLVMLSTAIYPAFDPRLPAALSRRIADRELRGRAGFRGVSVSDALDTPATRPFGGPGRVAVRAAGAGTDLVLFGRSYRRGAAAARALERALRSGRLDEERFDRSVERVLRLRGSLSR